MPPSTPLLVFVSLFAADQAGGIQAFQLDPQKGTLAPAAVTRDCPNGFFLMLSPDRRTLYSLTAKKFGAADTEEVIAWRIADRAGTLEPLGRRPARGPASCSLATDPAGRALLIAHYNGATVAVLPLAADGRLTLVEIVPSRGRGPQNLALTPDGSLLLSANMPGDSLAVFQIDRETGKLTAVGEPAPVKMPSCIAIVP